ncbi:hypothetical protein ACFLSJ_05125 [Verrucomicrobiota bacterium]
MKKLVMIWDYRMRWAPPGRAPAYKCGGQPYLFGEDVFVEDFKRCIDFLSAHGYDGLAVWGLLRDSHGGEETVRALCDYANQRGTGILATMGVGCYGGAYWEGEHRFNLDTFLASNPSLAAVDGEERPLLKGQHRYPWSMACPSQPLVREWTVEAAEWVAGNFDVAGFEFQCGDYGLCQCSKCRERAGEDRDAKFSFRDVVDLVAGPMQAAHRIRDSLLLTVNTYMAVREGKNLAGSTLREGLPPYAYVTWWCHTSPVCVHPEPAWPTLDCDLSRWLSPGNARLDLPGPRNIGQMVVNTTAYYGDKYIYLDAISKTAALAHEVGLDGIMMYGELCEFPHLVNYLALEAFLANPDMTMLEFWRWAGDELKSVE